MKERRARGHVHARRGVASDDHAARSARESTNEPAVLPAPAVRDALNCSSCASAASNRCRCLRFGRARFVEPLLRRGAGRDQPLGALAIPRGELERGRGLRPTAFELRQIGGRAGRRLNAREFLAARHRRARRATDTTDTSRPSNRREHVGLAAGRRHDLTRHPQRRAQGFSCTTAVAKSSVHCCSLRKEIASPSASGGAAAAAAAAFANTSTAPTLWVSDIVG